MKQSLRQMFACHWSARRIQRYLDADPAAPLTPGEIARLEEHLSTCQKCAQTSAEHEALHRALSKWPGRPLPDEASIERLRTYLDKITGQQ
ncbi:MAG: zf-HC2 domain-containing protein [Dermatophilaceae bacterium]